ncbi:MAG TPA: VIT domain-containing protein [Phycisphaerae bacterium]|nr:VIT domain-containing protein [Phycisphaerae bacterium]
MIRRVGFLLLGILASILFLSRVVRADGLIVVKDPPQIVRGHFSFAPLEVTYHKVSCEIHDQVATTSVDQEFYNPNGARLEGDYIFPIPTDARVDKFAMDIDGKMVEAELLSAEKARGIYEDIVRKMKDPALLEYAGRAMFRAHIFPIEANGRKRITLKYTELLKQENGLLDYHYTLNTEKYSSRPLQNLSVKVDVSMSDPITSLYSPTHNVEIKRDGDHSAVVGYEARDVRPDTDFHLFIGRKSTPVGVTVLTYRPDAEKDGYFVLLAAPTVKAATTSMAKDVVFVMDTSGSMAGKKIEQARAALKYCVQTLNEKDRFDVVRFSTEAEPLFNGLQDATAENRKKAVDYAGTLQASGGTAIDEALKKALEERDEGASGRLSMLVFMTDGEPTVGESDPETIVRHVKEHGKAAVAAPRIFTFGVGNDVNTKLLDQLAEQTRGYSQYVLPEENLEIAMSNFWSKVQDPVLAGLKMECGAGVHLAKMYPHELPDLFKGDQLVAFGTYSGSGNTSIALTGNVNGEQRTFAEDVRFADKTDDANDWIAKLWATRRIGYLLDEMRRHGENKEVKAEIADLARRWGVVTPYTAMLIMEDEKRHNVPVAVQSLREMSSDAPVLSSVSVAPASVASGSATGGQAVKDSVNVTGYKMAGNLDAASAAAEQSDARLRFEGQAKGAMAKTVAPSGNWNIDRAKEYNLGTSTPNGWQAATAGDDVHGYRVITNYAQQTRIVNNRSFFLNGNQWTDTSVQQNAGGKHVKVLFNSDDYFDLLRKHPETAQYLALGSNVTLMVGDTVYDVVEEAAAN